MSKYIYEGPVMEFETCVSHKWKASTIAPTERKARANLTYRYKKETGKAPYAKITLPGKLKIAE